LFARGAFSSADAANAAATLSAYALGLVPFVLIRSASASFYARQDTATPVKAALAGVAVNVALKIVLAGSLAQVGLALGTAAGAWVNLVLVVVFAVSAGHLQFDREMRLGLVKFATAGIALAAGLLLARRVFSPILAQLPALRDESMLAILIAVGAGIYAAAILLLFGRRWLAALVR
jgi:putative peptidoglycan lipid II flippase